ncbi:MAG TPA: Lrp/AsnC family transcriptional regulator [Burkholderiales bacterium]|nr:Lrp/AsnC family transcriptional regulator [Burkholderiales bacterium]
MTTAPGQSALDFALLNDFQRSFPLCERPFAEIGRQLCASERWVLSRLARMVAIGQVSRVGAVFAPHAIGVSTLAALRVPVERLTEIAARVSRYRQVNHNYAREHALSLWFVVTALDEIDLGRVLCAIEADARCGPIITMPLLEEFRIDLGFDLRTGARGVTTQRAVVREPLTVQDRSLIGALENGVPLIARPFSAIAAHARMREAQVLARLRSWLDAGMIRRFGVVVRHHELGFAANAMAVWDVPDDEVSGRGRHLARQSGVTLCYRRRRAQPDWPYNLFCMVHGRDRASVRGQIDAMAQTVGLAAFPHALLFSTTRFKQRGACYASPAHEVRRAA